MSDSNKYLNEIGVIRGHLEQLIRQDSSNKRAFDTLYKELEQYKSDFVFKFEKSVLLDLLSFYDSMIWFQSTLENQKSDASDNFSYLVDEFYELLRRRDVLPCPPSEDLNRKHHRVIQLEDTADESKDKKVARVLRRGFFRGDRSLRDEEIILYRYQKPVEDPKAETPLVPEVAAAPAPTEEQEESTPESAPESSTGNDEQSETIPPHADPIIEETREESNDTDSQ